MIVISKEDSQAEESARKALAENPLAKRRAEIERLFLAELTRLTRKYGLELHADTRSEYGESYPDLSLKRPYRAGTNARYVFSDYRGIDFDVVSAAQALDCSAKERSAFEAALKARSEEDGVIEKLARAVSDAHWKMIENGMERGMQEQVREHAKRKPEYVCSCKQRFKGEKSLATHRTKTGHA